MFDSLVPAREFLFSAMFARESSKRVYKGKLGPKAKAQALRPGASAGPLCTRQYELSPSCLVKPAWSKVNGTLMAD